MVIRKHKHGRGEKICLMIELRLKTIYPDVSPKQRVKVRIELREITKTIPKNLDKFSVGDGWLDSNSHGIYTWAI